MITLAPAAGWFRGVTTFATMPLPLLSPKSIETFPSLECSFPIVDLGAYSEERAAAARKAVAPLEWFKRGSSRLVRYPWRGEDRLAVQPGVADDPHPIERATHALDPKRVCRHPAHPQVIGVP